MKYMTEELYKKIQLFDLPLDEGVSLEEVKNDWGLDVDDLFLQELLAKDEWYLAYTPIRLKNKLFNRYNEVIFEHLDDDIWTLVQQFRAEISEEFSNAEKKVRQEKYQVSKIASPMMRQFLELDLKDSEMIGVQGIDTKQVVIRLAVGMEANQVVTLTFLNVKESWMGKVHYDDANWWSYDEVSRDERENRYQLSVLFQHADCIGHLQMSFEDIEVSVEES